MTSRVGRAAILGSFAAAVGCSRMQGAAAQPFGIVDSALVARILLAEDRRDSNDNSIAAGIGSADARVRVIAQRALGRIRDPQFAVRDSLPPLAPPPAYPDPEWRVRYRALKPSPGNCDALAPALVDEAWPVRLRAMDVLTPPCDNEDVLRVLTRWVTELPADASRHELGGVSWHPAAHALVALARLHADGATAYTMVLAHHAQPEVRMYAARAAALLRDTTVLRSLAVDRDDNVKEAAIDALSRLTGHADDALYVAALASTGAQAVRAAAMALKGSPDPTVAEKLNATFERWVAHRNASERDARLALLDAAGRPASDDRPPRPTVRLPPHAIAMALGELRYVRVTMSAASGGGTFTVRLRGDAAPMMGARVLELANDHYYDGGHWHRVEHDFVIQGGGPGTNEYVGHAAYFRDELGGVPHVRGTVGMSTRGHDTGDAQWFINLKDNLRLNRDYSVFAEVVEGMEVVDAIVEGDVIATVTEITRPAAAGRPAVRNSTGRAAPAR